MIEHIGLDVVTLSHGSIPTLKWGPMTMDFKLPPRGLPRGMSDGDKVHFEFFMDADNLPQLTAVTQIAPQHASPSAAKVGSKP